MTDQFSELNQGKLRVYMTYPDKVEVFWDNVFTVVHDEHPSDIELDVVTLLAVLKQIEGCAAGQEKQGTELQLALY